MANIMKLKACQQFSNINVRLVFRLFYDQWIHNRERTSCILSHVSWELTYWSWFVDAIFGEHTGRRRFERYQQRGWGRHDGWTRWPGHGEGSQDHEVQREEKEEEVREADTICLEEGLCWDEAKGKRAFCKDDGVYREPASRTATLRASW